MLFIEGSGTGISADLSADSGELSTAEHTLAFHAPRENDGLLTFGVELATL
jgi:hypothetical protein